MNREQLMGMLASGLIGAILAQLLGCLWSYLDHRTKYRNLLGGIIAECKYCIPVADEICLDVRRGGSFKRMPVDYFRMAQERAVEYHMDEEVLTALAHVCVDLELFNLEADSVFNGQEMANVCYYKGWIGYKYVNMKRTSEACHTTPPICGARKGVLNSLRRLQDAAEKAQVK